MMKKEMLGKAYFNNGMKKRIISLALVFIFVLGLVPFEVFQPLKAYATDEFPGWGHSENYGSTKTERFFDVKSTSDGGYIAVGSANEGAAGIPPIDWGGEIESDASVVPIIVKYDKNNNVEWCKYYDVDITDFTAYDYGGSFYAVDETSDGGFVAVGYGRTSTTPYREQGYAVKYDKNGNQLWQEARWDMKLDDVVVDSDGSIIVVGGTSTFKNNTNTSPVFGLIAKYDASGNLQWYNKAGTGGMNYQNPDGTIYEYSNITITTDGNYVINGSGYGASVYNSATNNPGYPNVGTGPCNITVGYKPDGTLISQNFATSIDKNGVRTVCDEVIPSQDGGVVISNNDFIQKINQDGSRSTKILGNFSGLVATNDGGYFAIQNSPHSWSYIETKIVKYNEDLVPVWESPYVWEDTNNISYDNYIYSAGLFGIDVDDAGLPILVGSATGDKTTEPAWSTPRDSLNPAYFSEDAYVLRLGDINQDLTKSPMVPVFDTPANDVTIDVAIHNPADYYNLSINETEWFRVPTSDTTDYSVGTAFEDYYTTLPSGSLDKGVLNDPVGGVVSDVTRKHGVDENGKYWYKTTGTVAYNTVTEIDSIAVDNIFTQVDVKIKGTEVGDPTNELYLESLPDADIKDKVGVAYDLNSTSNIIATISDGTTPKPLANGYANISAMGKDLTPWWDMVTTLNPQIVDINPIPPTADTLPTLVVPFEYDRRDANWSTISFDAVDNIGGNVNGFVTPTPVLTEASVNGVTKSFEISPPPVDGYAATGFKIDGGTIVPFVNGKALIPDVINDSYTITFEYTPATNEEVVVTVLQTIDGLPNPPQWLNDTLVQKGSEFTVYPPYNAGLVLDSYTITTSSGGIVTSNTHPVTNQGSVVLNNIQDDTEIVFNFETPPIGTVVHNIWVSTSIDGGVTATSNSAITVEDGRDAHANPPTINGYRPVGYIKDNGVVETNNLENVPFSTVTQDHGIIFLYELDEYNVTEKYLYQNGNPIQGNPEISYMKPNGWQGTLTAPTIHGWTPTNILWGGWDIPGNTADIYVLDSDVEAKFYYEPDASMNHNIEVKTTIDDYATTTLNTTKTVVRGEDETIEPPLIDGYTVDSYKIDNGVAVTGVAVTGVSTTSVMDNVTFSDVLQDHNIVFNYKANPITLPEIADPEIIDPEIIDPEITDPEITDPEITDPEIIDPEITDPEIIDPEIIDPEIIDPEITDPEITDPEVIDPEITDPEITDPEIIDPEITDPEITDPEVIDPETTDPAAPDTTNPAPNPDMGTVILATDEVPLGDIVTLTDEGVPLGSIEGISPNREVFMKTPNRVEVVTGEFVDYTLSGIGNPYSTSVQEFAIGDNPPKGLTFVEGYIPAFEKGEGLEYKIIYDTNQRGETVLYEGLDATQPFSFKAPALNVGEYITGIYVVFDEVPVDFGLRNKITYTFKVTETEANKIFENKGFVSFKVLGQQVIIPNEGNSSVTVYGSLEEKPNPVTEDKNHTFILAVAVCLMVVSSSVIVLRISRKKFKIARFK